MYCFVKFYNKTIHFLLLRLVIKSLGSMSNPKSKAIWLNNYPLPL